MIYKVALEAADEGGYTVRCPVLPGCISEGDTKEEALENIKEAINLYLRALDKENQALAEKGKIEIIDVAV